MEAGPQHTSKSSSAASDRSGAPNKTSGGKSAGAKSKMGRIGDHARGLFDEFSSWLELRLRLFQVDVQDLVQKKIEEAISKAAPVFLGLLTLLFALVTVALFTGWALGHPAWGFLIVTGFLLVITLVLWVRSRRIAQASSGAEATEAVAENQLVEQSANGSPPDQKPSKASAGRTAVPKEGGLS